MSTIRNGVLVAVLASMGACAPQSGAYAQGTFPQDPQGQPMEVQGPPGGNMDPNAASGQYQAPQDPQQQYADPNDPNGQYGQYADPSEQQGDPQGDPQDGQQVDPNYGTGDVDDTQIDATLDAYGQWEQDDDYGRVWVPDATVVGADFTPYETDGSWVYSDTGYMFTCNYNWGWLPFHYGRWGWMNNHWGWVPGHNWGPAWVDWRYGGGYVGWRPMAPEWRNGREWQVRDHRGPGDAQWRFASEHDMGHGMIHGHLFQNPAEGLRVTQAMRPPQPAGITPVHSAAVMRAHMPARSSVGPMGGTRFGGTRPAGMPPHASNPGTRAFGGGPGPAFRNSQPTWRAPQQGYRQPMQTYRQPAQTYRQPMQTYRQPAQTYRQPAQTYRAPVQSYRPPMQTYHPSYSAPSHSYSAPSHSYSAPSHSSGGGGGGYHSSGGGGGGGGGHSGGGGGHHR